MFEWLRRAARELTKAKYLPEPVKADLDPPFPKELKQPSEAMIEAFMTSTTVEWFECKCGRCYIAERSPAGPSARAYTAAKMRGRPGPNTRFMPVDRLFLGAWRGEMFVVGCPCVLADMAAIETFVKAHAANLIEYLNYGREPSKPRR